MLKVVRDKLVILGIDTNNVGRLKAGDPIKVHGAEIGLDKDVYIVYGETLADIANELGLPVPENILKTLGAENGGNKDT